MASDKEKDDNAFYSRINEFGEYKFNNSLDTIFVLQITFIVILIFIALYYLNFYGLFSKLALYIVTIILVVLLIIIILNKTVVIPRIRSKAVWDKYNFGNGSLEPTTDHISGGKDGGDSGTSRSQTCTSSCSANTNLFG